jgi:hypothetical protein
MVLPEVCGGLDLDQTPAAIPAAVQDVHADQHAAMLECALEDRWNPGVCDELTCSAYRLIEPGLLADLHSTGEQLVGKQPHVLPLLHGCFDGGVWRGCQFRGGLANRASLGIGHQRRISIWRFLYPYHRKLLGSFRTHLSLAHASTL